MPLSLRLWDSLPLSSAAHSRIRTVRASNAIAGAALDMLAEQGWKGDRSRVLIVGDRFDTDIRGGSLAGVLLSVRDPWEV